MTVKRIALLLGMSLGLTHCATVFNGAYNGQVSFESQPEGALVVIDKGYPSCYTPCHLQVAMDRPHSYAMTIPGYLPNQGTLERKVAGTFWLNGILGVAGLMTSSMDWFTDSMWVLKKNTIAVTLQPAGAKGESQPKQLPQPHVQQVAPPEFKAKIAQSIPPEKMRDEVQKNFGVMSKEERAALSERLEFFMWQMEQQGVEPDLETAITREKARRERN